VNISCGVDLVEIARIERVLSRHPRRFLTRHYTQQEIEECGSDPARLAMRWAAKEAAVKALGTGIGPVGWLDVEIVSEPTGAPVLHLHGRARERAAFLGLEAWSVSLSDTSEHAAAVVVAAGA
jgi:holo-[acyl-carrier protein] synthase